MSFVLWSPKHRLQSQKHWTLLLNCKLRRMLILRFRCMWQCRNVDQDSLSALIKPVASILIDYATVVSIVEIDLTNVTVVSE